MHHTHIQKKETLSVIAHAIGAPVLADFTALYELYHAAILRYCSKNCRDHEVAQDITQNAFLRFWYCLKRGDEIQFARAFLYRIAHNLIIDYVRKKKESSLDVLLESGFEPSVDPWQTTFNLLDAERPMKKLATMRGPYRDALHYRYIRGMEPMEIAAMTGESANTISVRIFRGVRHLRGLLDEEPLAFRRGSLRGS